MKFESCWNTTFTKFVYNSIVSISVLIQIKKYLTKHISQYFNLLNSYTGKVSFHIQIETHTDSDAKI